MTACSNGHVHETATIIGTEKAPVHDKPISIHPLDQLYADEIHEVATAIRSKHQGAQVRFKFITALEPRKNVLVPYLDAVRQGKTPEPVSRIATVLYSAGQMKNLRWYECLYSLSDHRIELEKEVPYEHKPMGDPEEVLELEEILMKDETFLQALKRFKLPPKAVIHADPWGYGSDTAAPIPRLVTYLVYFLNPKYDDRDSNPYSFPIPICPVLDTQEKKVVEIIECPTGGAGDSTTARTLDEDDPVGHLRPAEYMAHMMDEPLRNDQKPIHISQPEGASFRVEANNRIFWQKWDFIITFNYREGIVLHDIHYDGRSVAYRFSLSEMTVPYGDPRAPYHRKQAFDSGDAGMGFCANELDLGCDCLGLIKYLDAVVASPTGTAKRMKNVVCMHEVDNGIQWKHTNYRTNNAAVVRSRELHIQSIATVSNYEYIWIFKFDQAGAFHLETRATGILSTAYIDKGKVSPWGEIVSPGVLAPNHQHAFSVRLDPAVGGHKNTVVYEDSVPVPVGPENPYGTAWTVNKTAIEKEGWADASPLTNRVFKITNSNEINPITQKPISYKFTPHPGALMLADPDSIAFKRAEFGGHHVWVSKYRDDELYAGGNYTYQSNGNASGMLSYVGREADVKDEDLVVWHTFVLTHNPRIEDFPVMPYESIQVSFKPAGFFTQNPSMDCPRSRQVINKSKLVEGFSESCCE